jgi:hypothetical protein
MLIDRTIVFLVLGFFVFIGGIDSWWSSASVFSWYANYLPLLGLICLCIWVQAAHNNKPGD